MDFAKPTVANHKLRHEQAPARTLGESLAHEPRHKIWMVAVFLQIVWPAVITACLYGLVSLQGLGFRSFFRGAPWRLPLALSYGFYWSLLYLIRFYAELFLPRTPEAVADKLVNVGSGVGVCISVIVIPVLACGVKDGRVLAGCTALVGVIIVGLAAFWVWLARTYGGDGDLSEGSTTLPPAEALEEGLQHPVPPRLPV
ncbi:hypothetical protein CFC21_039448 [Triticum aestivum]|uniref:DUF7378 domain-containing protein n=2 Tax=Triticum aestivum TaxID=4565 RepID=A0A9R1JRW9_WHEAT|nr:hypothetical protein CFC21_039448 [Triticum aestivum]CDM80926.1 unnamed protein product [Triticum aestivum]